MKTNSSGEFFLGDRIEVMKRLEPESVDFIFTSPPYNVGKAYKNHDDSLNYDTYLDFLKETWQESKRLLRGGEELPSTFLL